MLPFNSWMVLWSSRRIVSSERSLDSRSATFSRRPRIVSSSFAIVSLFCWLSLRVFSRLTFRKDVNGDILNEQSYFNARALISLQTETPGDVWNMPQWRRCSVEIQAVSLIGCWRRANIGNQADATTNQRNRSDLCSLLHWRCDRHLVSNQRPRPH